MKADLVLDDALQNFEKIYDPVSRAKSASDIAAAIIKTKPNDSLRWAEKALRLSENIKNHDIRENTVLSVINAVAKICPDISWSTFLRKDNPKGEDRFIRDQALLSLSIEFSKKDPHIALEQSKLINNQYTRDESLVSISKNLLYIDQNKALSLLEKIQDPVWNSKALYHITTSLFTIKPKKAFALSEKIKVFYWKNKATMNFANKLFYMRSKLWKKMTFYSLHNILKMQDFLDKARCLSQFSVLMSRSKTKGAQLVAARAARLALKIANRIKDPFSKSKALLDVFKAFLFLDLEECDQVGDLFFHSPEKIEDELMKKQMQISISAWLLDQKIIYKERSELYEKYEKNTVFSENELEKIFNDFEIQKTLETFDH